MDRTANYMDAFWLFFLSCLTYLSLSPQILQSWHHIPDKYSTHIIVSGSVLGEPKLRQEYLFICLFIFVIVISFFFLFLFWNNSKLTQKLYLLKEWCKITPTFSLPRELVTFHLSFQWCSLLLNHPVQDHASHPCDVFWVSFKLEQLPISLHYHGLRFFEYTRPFYRLPLTLGLPDVSLYLISGYASLAGIPQKWTCVLLIASYQVAHCISLSVVFILFG